MLLGACAGVNDGIRIDGSSTVYPLTEAVAEEFALSGARTAVRVGISGTGGGIEKFCRGEIDVANASREMRDREREACAAEGIDDPEALAFVDFYLAHSAQLAEEVGCIALTEEELATQRAELASIAARE